MSKLSINITIGSKSSQKTIKTKASITTQNSKWSSSFVSEHGSKFGRSVSKYPKQNDPGLVQTLSTDNSRVIRTVFNLCVELDSKLSDLTQVQSTECIRQLGKSLSILDYEFNYASFWLLDVLSKLLKDLQLKNISLVDQNTFLAWFRFVLRCISVSGASREEILHILQEMFKEAAKTISEGKSMPQPEEIFNSGITPSKCSADLLSLISSSSLATSISSKTRRRFLHKSLYKSPNATPKLSKTRSRKSSKSSSNSTASSNSVENTVKHNLELFYSIVEMIYQVFAHRFMYTMIRSAYASPAVVTPVDIKVDFNEIKQLKPEPVTPSTERKTSPKSRSRSVSRTTKNSKDKRKKKSFSTAEADVRSDKKKGNKLRAPKNVEIFSEVIDERKDSKATEENENKEKGKEGRKKRKSKKKEEKESNPEKLKEIDQKTLVSEKRSSKGKRSKLSQIKEKSSLLEVKKKLFDRCISPEMELETEKILTKDQYILSLSEAVSDNYVENLIRTMMPHENIPTEDNKISVEKQEKTKLRLSRHSSMKGRKRN